MTNCPNNVPGRGTPCGQERGFYCSDVCAQAAGSAELAELGITPEMMSEALAGYYECKEMIERRERDKTRQKINLPEKPPQSPYLSGQD